MSTFWRYMNGIFMYGEPVFVLGNGLYLPDGILAVVLLSSLFNGAKTSKTSMELELQKVKTAILEDFLWRSPGTLKWLFVVFDLLFILIYSFLQDHWRSRRSSLYPLRGRRLKNGFTAFFWSSSLVTEDSLVPFVELLKLCQLVFPGSLL